MDPEKPVKLAAKLPKENNANGLDTVHAQLRAHGTAIIIMQVTAPTREERVGGIVRPQAEIEWVEGLPGSAKASLGDIGSQLLQLARAERLGEEEGALFSRQDILAGLFNRLDPKTDEQD
jgi:hypothetical protein